MVSHNLPRKLATLICSSAKTGNSAITLFSIMTFKVPILAPSSIGAIRGSFRTSTDLNRGTAPFGMEYKYPQ